MSYEKIQFLIKKLMHLQGFFFNEVQYSLLRKYIIIYYPYIILCNVYNSY